MTQLCILRADFSFFRSFYFLDKTYFTEYILIWHEQNSSAFGLFRVEYKYI